MPGSMKPAPADNASVRMAATVITTDAIEKNGLRTALPPLFGPAQMSGRLDLRKILGQTCKAVD